MRDIKMQLVQHSILEEALAPGGKAHGYKVVCTGHSLGAGIAVLLALELRASLGEVVRYVGFEPPACLSPRLALETQKLGWYSSVLVQDWIPRLSLRTLQMLREDVLDELLLCQHSKLQLAVHFSAHLLIGNWHWWRCLRRICTSVSAKLIRPFVGRTSFVGSSVLWRRRLDTDVDLEMSCDSALKGASLTSTETLRALEMRRAQRREPNFFAEEMCCPGRLVVLRPTVSERILGGCWSRDIAWVAEWGLPEHLQEMLVTPRAVEYHFPHIVASALSASLRSLGSFAALRLLEPKSLPTAAKRYPESTVAGDATAISSNV